MLLPLNRLVSAMIRLSSRQVFRKAITRAGNESCFSDAKEA